MLNPIVGIVCTFSPSLILYNIEVLPAPSSPTISILKSFGPKNLEHNFEQQDPLDFNN